jgi:hypothetical protein
MSTTALAPLLLIPPAKHMKPSCGRAAAERWERAADRADVLQVPAAASNMSTAAKSDLSSLPPANMAMAWRGRAAAAR